MKIPNPLFFSFRLFIFMYQPVNLFIMSVLAILAQESILWRLFFFFQQHSLISILLMLFVLRYVVRWFFGITKIRRAQDRYNELLEQHTTLLERQNRLLEEHESVLNRLGEKLL